MTKTPTSATLSKRKSATSQVKEKRLAELIAACKGVEVLQGPLERYTRAVQECSEAEAAMEAQRLTVANFTKRFSHSQAGDVLLLRVGSAARSARMTKEVNGAEGDWHAADYRKCCERKPDNFPDVDTDKKMVIFVSRRHEVQYPHWVPEYPCHYQKEW